MQHLDDGLIQELIDGEIASHDLAPMQAHLAACESCRARLDTARMAAAEADELLIMLDEVEPAASAPAPMVLPIRKPHWSRNLAWAASLMLAAGLGYAGRGSIDDLLGVAATEPSNAERSTPTLTATPTTPGVTSATREPPGVEPQPLAERATRESGLASRGNNASTANPDAADLARREARNDPAPAPAAPVGLARDQAPPPAAPVTSGAGAAEVALEGRQAGRVLSEQEAASIRAARRAEVTSALTQNQLVPAGRPRSLAVEDAAKSMVAAREVDLPTAMRLLGGSIKLIDGLVPHRLDATGTEVMVVYRVVWGELLLSQQRDDDRIVWHLTGPPGFPPDSLAALRGKVRP